MATYETLIRQALRPQRWARMQRVLDRRLGAVRLAVEDLHHPHNMSAVLRTCDALGVQHVHTVEVRDLFAVSRRVTRGAHKWLSVHRHPTFAACAEDLRARGFRLFAALLDPAAIPLEEIPVDRPVALVLGNERDGVSSGAAALCDGTYTIPMDGFVQSLNVSVAAGISLYSLTRRIRALHPDGGRLTPSERQEVLRSWLPKSLRCGRRVVRAAGSRSG